MSRGASIRVGVSGWRYAPWRGSFYSLQKPATYRAWHAATPPGFVFTVKGPRYLTHVLRLREIDRPLANFFASGIFELKEKLGALLWQFPPTLRWDPELFERFCDASAPSRRTRAPRATCSASSTTPTSSMRRSIRDG